MTYVALLRGINVGGNKMVAMADLREALTRMGFADVRTLLQSGNVVFTGKRATAAALETQLEKEVAKRLGVSADFHVRTAAELTCVIEGNPFAAEAESDPSHLLVTFYKTSLDAARVAAFQKSIAGRERVRADGRHLYMTFPDGIGTSKAAITMDKLLAARGTSRNWNTVTKLALMTGNG